MQKEAFLVVVLLKVEEVQKREKRKTWDDCVLATGDVMQVVCS